MAARSAIGTSTKTRWSDAIWARPHGLPAAPTNLQPTNLETNMNDDMTEWRLGPGETECPDCEGLEAQRTEACRCHGSGVVRRVTDPETLYWCDTAIACGEHVGVRGRALGRSPRDLPLRPMVGPEIAHWAAELGRMPRCELGAGCNREPHPRQMPVLPTPARLRAEGGVQDESL
jgi:hypothetical protein